MSVSIQEEVEALRLQIESAMQSGQGHSFPSDEFDLQDAVFMEDIVLLKAFLPVVGKWRLANLINARDKLQRNGHEDDWAEYLTDDCLSTEVRFRFLFTKTALSPKGMESVYVLAMVSSEEDRERLVHLVRDRGLTDITEIKAVLKAMEKVSSPLSSGSL